MDINRRIAIKNLLFIAAGTTLLPSCFGGQNESTLVLKNISINGDQEQILSEFCETIIPATDTPGAKDVGAHLFAIKLIDECSTKNEQRAFEKGLRAFEQFSKDKVERPFHRCTENERVAILTAIEKQDNVAEDVIEFYSMMKGLTIDSYITSKYYLTKVRVYELVPARFKGCVPVKKDTKKQIEA
jgi:hypothetical protein